MYLQVIRFQLAALTDADYRALGERLAPLFGDVPGLLAKIWLADPDTCTYGGVYLWWDRQALERFAHTELFAALAAPAHATNLCIEDYAVQEGPTLATLGILAPQPVGAAVSSDFNGDVA